MKAWFAHLWAVIRADIKNALAIIGDILGTALSHIDSAATWLFNNIESLATTLGDPHLNDQLHTVITDAKWFGKWLLTVSIIATVAQFKKLVQSPPAA